VGDQPDLTPRKLNCSLRYKDAGEALRRKQDKEREAAGLAPVQRTGGRGGQRGAPSGQRGAPARGRGAPASRGGPPSRTFHQADKSLYVHLLGHLKKKGLLPVVVFTFSKKRCEENAATLTNADLCTSMEKSEVHVAIEKALSRLKGAEDLFIDHATNRIQVPIGSCLKLPGCVIYSRVV
jgi:antiviral helicase SKI2